MGKHLDHGDTFVHDGRTFKVFIEDDDDRDPPWKESDGHGPVSEFVDRSKRPGERVLSQDRFGKRYYDVQEATRLAKQDGWGLSDENKAELIERLAQPRVLRRGAFGRKVPGRDPNKPLTAGEIRAEAVRRDFEFLQGWVDDNWRYVGVIVVHVPNGAEPDEVVVEYDYALWGIESCAEDHMDETAYSLAKEAAASIDAEMNVLRSQLHAERAKAAEIVRQLHAFRSMGLEDQFSAVIDAAREQLRMHQGTCKQCLAALRELRRES